MTKHFREAGRLLAEVTRDDGSIDFGDGGDEYVAAAQVHALLANVAIQAVGLMPWTSTGNTLTEWESAIGPTGAAS